MIPFIFLNDHEIFCVNNNNTELLLDLATVPEIAQDVPHLVDIAIGEDSDLYVFSSKTIYLYNLISKTTNVVYSLPHTPESGYIRHGLLRDYNRLYFSLKKKNEIIIYRISSQSEAVPYHTLRCKDLLLPPVPGNGCEYPDGYEVIFNIEPSEFAFDDRDNLYVSNGYGYWRLAQAGPDNVKGVPQRIHLNYKQICRCLVCWDSNTLFSISKSESHSAQGPEFPFVVMRRIDLLPPSVTDEVVFSGKDFHMFDDQVKGFKLIPGNSLSNYLSRNDIRWVQKSLNIVFPPTPPLEIDGILGIKTRAAIKAFQEYYQPAYGVDGIPGPLTRAKLIQVLNAHFA